MKTSIDMNLRGKAPETVTLGSDVDEGNKLIMKFIGVKVNKTSYAEWWYDIKDGNRGYLDVLEYHSNWSWLMPVVEKIEHCEDTNTRGYSFHVVIFDKDCHIYEYLDDDEMPIIDKEGKTKLEATWLAVVEFINWYNKNKNQ